MSVPQAAGPLWGEGGRDPSASDRDAELEGCEPMSSSFVLNTRQWLPAAAVLCAGAESR